MDTFQFFSWTYVKVNLLKGLSRAHESAWYFFPFTSDMIMLKFIAHVLIVIDLNFENFRDHRIGLKLRCAV